MPKMLSRFMRPEIVILTCLLLGLGKFAAHCTTTSRSANSLGIVSYSENPNVYLLGSMIDGSVLRDGDSYATNVRFSPAFTYALFDEAVLFCGDVSAAFNSAHGPIVIAYRRSASRRFQGIGCHELLAVNTVQAANP